MNNLEYAYVGFAGDGEINQIKNSTFSNTSREKPALQIHTVFSNCR